MAEAQGKVDSALREVRKSADDHMANLRGLQQKHEEVIKKQRMDLEKKHGEQLESCTKAWDKRIAQVKADLGAEKGKRCKLENEIRRHEKVCKGEKGGGCFPGSSTVAVVDPHGRFEQVPMRRLGAGHRILSSGAGSVRGQCPVPEHLLGWYDYYGEGVGRDFLRLHHEHGAVTLTGNHLLFVHPADGGPAVPLQAASVTVGMLLLACTDPEAPLVPSRVCRIEAVWLRGIYGPATLSGRLLVDGVLVSAYAKPTAFRAMAVSDGRVQQLCHGFSAPLRCAWRLRLSLGLRAQAPGSGGAGFGTRVVKLLASLLLSPWL